MRKYIFFRFLQFIPLLLGMTFISFVIMQMAPGDYFTQMQMNPEVSPQTIEVLRQNFGLDRSVVIQYFYWLKNIMRFNLGESFSYHIPVAFLIKQKLKNTLAISLFSIFFIWLIAIPLGIFSAIKQGKWQEKSLSFLAYIGISLPSFLIAMLLVFFAAKTAVLPVGGTTSAFYIGATGWGRVVDYLKHLFLPGCALTLAGIGGLYRLMKNNFLEVLSAPYVVTAYAKGLSPARIYFKHTLRNAINPMITIFGYTLSSVLSGAALVEIITNWPGMGRLMLEAVLSQDLYLVMASLLIGGILLIAGNLIADILIAVADPRVRLR